jgi:hypothetical protein
MVKDGLKISMLAGMFVVYPAFADGPLQPGDMAKNIAQQAQPMDQAAPDASFEPESYEDHRADMTADFKPQPDQNAAPADAQFPPNEPAASAPAPALSSAAQQEQQLPPTHSAASAPPVNSQSAMAQPDASKSAPQQLASNNDAPHPDYQTSAKADDDNHGHELSESEENVYESDQQQYEQAQAALDPDKKNNELSDRITQEQNKLQSDSAKNDNIAMEEDNQSLMLDKQELQKQELASADRGLNLDEFNGPDRAEMPMSADNNQAPLPDPLQPQDGAAPAKNPELAMNTQTPRVPW